METHIVSCSSNYPLSPSDFYYIPSSEEKGNTLRSEILNLNDGFILGARIVKENDKTKMFSYLTKYKDILLSPNSIIYNINDIDLRKDINILVYNKNNVCFQLSPKNTKNKNFTILTNWKNIHQVEIIVLFDNSLCGKIFIDGKHKFRLKFFSFCKLHENSNLILKTKKKLYTIYYFIDESFKFFIEFDSKLYSFQLDENIIQDTKMEINNCDLRKRGLLVSNLVNSFTQSNSKLGRNDILNQIITLVSKDQKDVVKRNLGLEALRNIYKSGEVDLINNLWKECKNSFDVQPYNIIDIKELVMDAELGNGTFGCVKKATWNSRNGRMNVAVKIIQENNQMFDLSDLRGEFVALSLLEHENIIKMHGGGFIEQDLGIHNSIHWFIVMDLMDGNVAEIIKKSYNSLTFEDKLKITYQILLGLHHLHKHKIIHRDIKPENILYKKESNGYLIKIADLGISKPATDTILRTAIGTHNYMAPELCNTKTGRAEFGKEVDIYSLGILLWELFTGMTPDDFLNARQSRFTGTNIKFPSRIPTWITKLITQCTSTNPLKRPTTSSLTEQFSSNMTPRLSRKPSSTEPISKNRVNKQPLRNSTNSIAKHNSIWFWRSITSTSLKQFKDNISDSLENGYLQYLGEESKEITIIDPKNSDITLLVDYLNFNLLDINSKEIIYNIRRKIYREANETKTIIAYCTGKDLRNNLTFNIKGYPSEDCCDVLISVTYSYYEKTELKRVSKYGKPYSHSIPVNSNGYVNILLEFDKHEPQITEIPLSFTYELARKTFDLAALKSTSLYVSKQFPEYTKETFNQLKKHVYILMKDRNDIILNKIMKKSKNILYDIDSLGVSHDVYNGFSGYAYYLLKCGYSNLYPKDISSDCIQQAKELLLLAEEKFGNDFSNISFYNSCTGVYAILAHLYFMEDDIESCTSTVNKLLDFSINLSIPAMFDRDIINGFSGYMLSLLYIMKHVQKSYYDNERMKSILYNCFIYLCDGNSDIIKFSFRNWNYFGASHGISGILFAMLHIPELVFNEKYDKKIENSLSYLLKKQFQGVFPVGEDSLSIRYHWCHGSPGIIPTLLQAYKIYGDSKYLTLAKDSIEIIYEKGILRKGYNLCHGICGNAYSFLYVYQITKNSKYLYYALNFCSTISDPKTQIAVKSYKDKSRKIIGKADHPYSLMEGIAGEGCLCIDIQNPEKASFPGYYNDLESTSIF